MLHYALGKDSEQFDNTGSGLGAGAEVLASEAHGVAFGLLEGNLPVGDVTLVAGDENGRLLGEISEQLLHPYLHLVPGLEIRDIIYNQRAYTLELSRAYHRRLGSTPC